MGVLITGHPQFNRVSQQVRRLVLGQKGLNVYAAGHVNVNQTFTLRLPLWSQPGYNLTPSETYFVICSRKCNKIVFD